MYHYRGAGLDNVYLKNGYRKIKYGREVAVAVEDAAGLHRVIAAQLIHKPGTLTSQEFRFLRIEMGLSQQRLGKLLGVGEQSVHQWENRKTKRIPGAAERTTRLLAGEQLLKTNGKVARLLNELAELDNTVMEQMCFEETNGGWAAAA